MHHTIYVHAVSLTDGSLVFNVHVGPIYMHAITEADAVKMAEGLLDLIEAHSNDTAEIVTCGPVEA